MTRKGKALPECDARRIVMKKFICVLLVISAILVGAFSMAACDTKEVEGGGTVLPAEGINAVLWEGKTVNVPSENVGVLFESVPERDGYFFGGWYFDNETWEEPADYDAVVNADDGTVLYARWLDDDEVVKVTFYDWSDSLVIYSAYFLKGSNLNGYVSASDKPSDETYDYYFAGWDQPLSNVTEDLEVRPVYDKRIRTFSVTFVVNGITVSSQSVEYGGSATAPSDQAVQAALPVEKGVVYRFAGWNKKFSEITTDLKVSAVLTSEYAKYTVTFNYGDGKSESQTVTYGENAVPPTNEDGKLDKTPTDNTDYTFVGWDGNYCFVTGDRIINAIYNDNVRYYTVDFYDGDLLYCRRYVPYGGSALLPESDPVKASDASFDYTFDGWSEDAVNVTSDMKIYAKFESSARKYTVSFYVEGVWVGDRQAEYGGSVTAPSVIQFEDKYEFVGWDGSLEKVTSDRKLNAVLELRTFDVTFRYGTEDNYTDLVVKDVKYGHAAVAPAGVASELLAWDSAQYHYLFAGWDSDFSSVTQDITVFAVYDKVVRVYAVNFVNDEGDRICGTQYVEYGASATQPSAEQTQKASDEQYDYTFVGWDTDAWTNVTGDVTAVAVYDKTVRTFDVVFIDDDGVIIKEGTASYGDALSTVAPQDPAKEQTAQYAYSFSHWADGEGGEISLSSIVTADITLTAVYTATVRTYTVTFIFGDGDSKVEQVEYGASATEPTAEEAKKETTATTQYVFQGWDNANWLNVTEDVTVYAKYLEIEVYHCVRFYAEDGSTLLSAPQYVRYGKDSAVLPDSGQIVKQQTVSHTYTFDGWNYTTDGGESGYISHQDLALKASQIDDSYTFTAHFTEALRKYTVVFYDDDRTTVIDSQSVDYGTSAIEPEAPTKAMTAQWIYTFAGWDSDKWTNIGGDTVVYATYSQELRKYDVTFVYGNVSDEASADYRTTTIQVGYGLRPEVPADIDTTRPSTAKYDYTFVGWDGLLEVSGDMIVTANYSNKIRTYKVTFYNMTTGVLDGESTLEYGSWIERTMSMGGYLWDSWYTKNGDDYTALPLKSEVTAVDEDGELVGHVQGDMTLYGNLVMDGFEFDSSNNINAYKGDSSFVHIPTYANRQKVNRINKRIFAGRTQEEIASVYLPLGVQVSGEAFRSLDRSYGLIQDADTAKTVIIYCEAEDDGGWDAGRDQFDTDWDSGIEGKNKYFNVKGIETVGDYNYVLLADNTAIIQKFVNATKQTVEIPANTVEVKSGENAGVYTITELTGSAFDGMSNVTTVFIANEWKNKKFGSYIFSGLTATIYLAIDDKDKFGNRPAIEWGGASGYEVALKWADWSLLWANIKSGDEGSLTLEWNCDGLYTDSDKVTYLLRSNGEATALSQEYVFFLDATKLSIPEKFTVNEKEYTVTELGAQLFKDEKLLTSVTIPSSIKKIGDQAFYGTNLSSLTLAEGLEKIGDLAFAMNTNLKYVYVPASCSEIGYFAFTGAKNVELFMGRSSAPTGSGLIGYKMGWNYTTELSIGDLVDISSAIDSLIANGTKLPTYWSAVGKVTVTEPGYNTGVYARVDLVYIAKKDGTAHLYKAAQNGGYLKLNNFSIAGTVTFNDVEYPVSTILNGTFSGYSVSTVFIPSTVTTIEANAFDSAVTIKTDAAEQPAGWSLPEGSTVVTGQSGLK